MYSFNNTKNDIIAFVKNYGDFEKCYIVRNIYSRFAFYIIAPSSLESFEVRLKEKFHEWVDTVQQISEVEDKFIFNDLSSTSTLVENSGKIFFSERHVENTNWYIKDALRLSTPVTSFYSFKGGVGRTTTTILTALLLARQGKKILLIDFDLEAPGLASLFATQEDNAEQLLAVKGFVDFLIDYEANKRDISKLSIDDYYFVKNEQILVGSNGGELVIVPAISTDSSSADSYIDKLSKANIKYGFGKDYIPDLFLKSLETKVKPDYILIDTRTGINDVGGLVFNRYAQNIFLIFYGNQQNMFGLESILPELKQLNEKDVKFYLVNSPVPQNPTDAKIETDYYVEKSYEIFSKYFYGDNLPSQFDETADHYPISIPFNPQALILNNYRRLGQLIESSQNSYQQIANLIVSNKIETVDEKVGFKNIPNEKILDSIINIDRGLGTSEVEFRSEEDLKNYFYPRKDYKYIFEKDKFLILGDKGVGKTALFSVLSHQKYAKALAEFCGVETAEIENTEWIIGLEKPVSANSNKFPYKANYEATEHFSPSQFRNYWIILLIRQLEKELTSDSVLKNEIFTSPIKDIKDIAVRNNVGEDLYEILNEVNSKLKEQNKTLIIVYDHLDAELPSENNIRGKLVSSLLTLFYDNLHRLSNIKAKIFLRNDIFNREANDITDKVKIQNYSVKIEWQYNQLLNVIWKRIYEQNSSLSIFEGILFPQNNILGTIPNFSTENEHKEILDKIFGKNMGGNNKAYPYNWVRLHIEDTNSQIHPRTLIKLFAESARLQKDDKQQPNDRIIRSKNIELALQDSVSKHQVQELGEEYPELKNIFTELSGKVGGRSPMNENDLINSLKSFGYNDPIDTINKLKVIGLLKDYKPSPKTKTDNEERRYHIPDLYLFGLNFTRKGTK
ncbi:MinD/ParA family ATP-binding protein [Flectobacillus roseus]|uniref:MinD/ParA family ATP-binding protein n=1 Tax=Flectobacillus roseus TaxID=502259 RepID=UPI0024B7BE53|nr:AAA family ATPase [Flectobacillus roseus]MDI9869537.1 AAA family ATPase [Flectobacillus roseus]